MKAIKAKSPEESSGLFAWFIIDYFVKRIDTEPSTPSSVIM
jgi:hypothetical protein